MNNVGGVGGTGGTGGTGGVDASSPLSARRDYLDTVANRLFTQQVARAREAGLIAHDQVVILTVSVDKDGKATVSADCDLGDLTQISGIFQSNVTRLGLTEYNHSLTLRPT